MGLSHALQVQVGAIFDVVINSAVSFIEEQPLGSHVEIWELNRATAGVGVMLNLKVLQERMVERRCTRAFYIVKGSRGNAAMLLVIAADAHQAILRVQAPRGPRPPQTREVVGAAANG